jgi:hypothetical protein
MHHPDKNFIHIGKTDIVRIADALKEFPAEDWDSYTFRQARYKDHSETKTIPLIWSERFKGIEYWPHYQRFESDISGITSILSDSLGDGVVISAILINLPSGCKIARHRDANYNGDRFNLCRRIHIPIITNEECIFEIAGEEMHMKSGEIWEISNVNKMHSVKNGGKTDRIHFLIDYAPVDVWERYFKKEN